MNYTSQRVSQSRERESIRLMKVDSITVEPNTRKLGQNDPDFSLSEEETIPKPLFLDNN